MGKEEAAIDDGHREGERRQQGLERGRVFGVVTKPPKDPSLSQLPPDHLSRSQSYRIELSVILGKGTLAGSGARRQRPQLGPWIAV